MNLRRFECQGRGTGEPAAINLCVILNVMKNLKGRVFLTRPFLCAYKNFGGKIRCAGCSSLIYNDESHGKVATEFKNGG